MQVRTAHPQFPFRRAVPCSRCAHDPQSCRRTTFRTGDTPQPVIQLPCRRSDGRKTCERHREPSSRDGKVLRPQGGKLESRSITFPAPSHTTKANAAIPTIAKAARWGPCGALRERASRARTATSKSETDDPSTRTGKHHRAYETIVSSRGQWKHVAANPAKDQQGQAGGKSKFHETGKMITVYERTEGSSALGQYAEPVDLRIRREVLDDAQERNRKTKKNQKPCEIA